MHFLGWEGNESMGGSLDIGYITRRHGKLEIDELRDNYRRDEYKVIPNSHPQIPRLKKLGRKYGLTFEVIYSYKSKRYEIYATNGRGFRFHIHTLENSDKTYRTLDARTYDHMKKILYYNANRDAYRRDLKYERLNRTRKETLRNFEERTYLHKQNRHLLQKVGRATGMISGSSNIPYGRPRKR